MVARRIFQLSLFYKEIEIVPFSYYVRYRYANARSLMQYTRSYVPQRESWVEALEYVVACANSAIADSKKFVREYVWNEVEQMMEGLRKCLSAKEFKDEIFPCEYEDAPYLGVRKTASPELGDRPYLARPEDLLVLIKAEKVVGALAMLERLKVLKIIADRVAAAISEIVFGVKQILPEVQNALSRVKDELADFGAKISMLDAKILSARRKVADYDKALEKLMDDAVADMPEDRKNSLPDVNGTKNSVKSRYAVQHPEYVKLKEDLLGMNHERERLIEARDGRSGLAAELEKCYGVGVAGKDFVCVIDKLQPHLETIERMVLFQLGRMKGKGRPVVEVRKAEEARYRKDHPDLEPLFEVRENVLSEIEGLCYSQTNGQKRKEMKAMYDFIGKVKAIRKKNIKSYDFWEMDVWDVCDDTKDDNFAVFRIDGKLLNDSRVKEKDWVKIRFVLVGREYTNSEGTVCYCNAVCRRIKVLAAAPEKEASVDESHSEVELPSEEGLEDVF